MIKKSIEKLNIHFIIWLVVFKIFMAKQKETLKLRSWYSNKYQLVMAQKKILTLFSLLSIATVVISVIFVKQFTESKSFEPYVVELEEKTGVLNVVDNLTESTLTADESIKKSYIYKFLNAGEGYNYITFEDDRKTLGLLTTTQVYRQMYNKYSLANENSIVNTLQNRGTFKVKVKSIIFNTPTVATVRFVIYNSKPSKLYPAEMHKIAEIQFVFSTAMQLSAEDRYINPLGFQVNKYSVGDDINM